MFRKWWCLHWFDPPTTREYSCSKGPIIAGAQRSYLVTEETRVCCRCGLIDRRKVGDPIYEGWN